MQMKRGWKKDEFSTPDLIWNVKLEGTYTEKRNGVEKVCKLSGTAVKLTYMFLVRCLDIYGEVFPPYETIAKFTEQSAKNAQRCVAYLEKVGLIRKMNRFNEEGMKISNFYMIFHPAQIPGLELIEEKPSIFGTDATSYRMDATSHPKNLGESANPSTFGTDATSHRMDATSHNNSSSSSFIKSSSVVSDPAFQKLSIAWKDCFQDDLEEWEFLELMKLRDLDFILGQIKLIKEHHDLDSIQSPYAFVSSCLKKKNGYKVPKTKGKKATPKKPKLEKPGHIVDLPGSVRRQEEQAATKEPADPQETEDVVRVRARIAKLMGQHK
jgi:hypothetical protein